MFRVFDVNELAFQITPAIEHEGAEVGENIDDFLPAGCAIFTGDALDWNPDIGLFGAPNSQGVICNFPLGKTVEAPTRF
jgi:hypothetical protein